jgi:molybdopterin/thiamine biosynthesis adenylyltransferase
VTGPAGGGKLRPDQVERYSRQLLLPEFGAASQKKLAAATVLCVGAGGLGSAALPHLAASGVGRIILVEDDRVELSNLQRQTLHQTADVGRPKIESAIEKLQALNPDTEIIARAERLDAGNVAELIESCDGVVDGSDNFATRFLVGDQCFLSGKPLCHGAVGRWEGQATTFDPRRGETAPCYRCLFTEPPPLGAVPSCAEAGVLGPLVGMIGCLQAAEAIKLLTGVGEPLLGRLLIADARSMDWRTLRYRRSRSCPLCGPNPSIRRAEPVAEVSCSIDSRLHSA